MPRDSHSLTVRSFRLHRRRSPATSSGEAVARHDTGGAFKALYSGHWERLYR